MADAVLMVVRDVYENLDCTGQVVSRFQGRHETLSKCSDASRGSQTLYSKYACSGEGPATFVLASDSSCSNPNRTLANSVEDCFFGSGPATCVDVEVVTIAGYYDSNCTEETSTHEYSQGCTPDGDYFTRRSTKIEVSDSGLIEHFKLHRPKLHSVDSLQRCLHSNELHLLGKSELPYRSHCGSGWRCCDLHGFAVADQLVDSIAPLRRAASQGQGHVINAKKAWQVQHLGPEVSIYLRTPTGFDHWRFHPLYGLHALIQPSTAELNLAFTENGRYCCRFEMSLFWLTLKIRAPCRSDPPMTFVKVNSAHASQLVAKDVSNHEHVERCLHVFQHQLGSNLPPHFCNRIGGKDDTQILWM